MLDSEAKKKLEANQQVWLEPVIEENQGNFFVVRFRAETDAVVGNHLKQAPKNAQYTKKTIQNELIDVVGNHTCSTILHEIERAKFYSVIADELSDVLNKVSLCF